MSTPNPNPIVEAEFTLLKRHMPGTSIRGARRYHSDLATLCRMSANPGENGTTAWVHDISTVGIALICPQELAVAAALTLRLRKSDQSGFISISATVIHATPEVSGAWRIGCRFERELSDDELDSCLQS